MMKTWARRNRLEPGGAGSGKRQISPWYISVGHVDNVPRLVPKNKLNRHNQHTLPENADDIQSIFNNDDIQCRDSLILIRVHSIYGLLSVTGPLSSSIFHSFSPRNLFYSCLSGKSASLVWPSHVIFLQQSKYAPCAVAWSLFVSLRGRFAPCLWRSNWSLTPTFFHPIFASNWRHHCFTCWWTTRRISQH